MLTIKIVYWKPTTTSTEFNLHTKPEKTQKNSQCASLKETETTWKGIQKCIVVLYEVPRNIRTVNCIINIVCRPPELPSLYSDMNDHVSTFCRRRRLALVNWVTEHTTSIGRRLNFYEMDVVCCQRCFTGRTNVRPVYFLDKLSCNNDELRHLCFLIHFQVIQESLDETIIGFDGTISKAMTNHDDFLLSK